MSSPGARRCSTCATRSRWSGLLKVTRMRWPRCTGMTPRTHSPAVAASAGPVAAPPQMHRPVSGCLGGSPRLPASGTTPVSRCSRKADSWAPGRAVGPCPVAGVGERKPPPPPASDHGPARRSPTRGCVLQPPCWVGGASSRRGRGSARGAAARRPRMSYFQPI